MYDRVFAHPLLVHFSNFLKCRDPVVSDIQLCLNPCDSDLLFFLQKARHLRKLFLHDDQATLAASARVINRSNCDDDDDY